MDNQYGLILDENFITSTCVPQCPLECNRTIYKAFVSSCEIIGDFYYDYIQSNANLLSDFVERNLTIESAKDSFTFALLYYNSNSYTLSTETPSMDVVTLLATIGGTLGLFLGVSLMHMCELVDVLIQIVFIKAKFNKIAHSPPLKE